MSSLCLICDEQFQRYEFSYKRMSLAAIKKDKNLNGMLQPSFSQLDFKKCFICHNCVRRYREVVKLKRDIFQTPTCTPKSKRKPPQSPVYKPSYQTSATSRHIDHTYSTIRTPPNKRKSNSKQFKSKSQSN
ncbi:unnamed protein product [Owenia fusiformis]|uniref:Uncharacterized protein n=1 Tax=Owenia fusiformis TaxID=6347 RepID=A0A8S4P1H7_OWEFU|nr:unnamed protein product [Owenia fusiformis]